MFVVEEAQRIFRTPWYSGPDTRLFGIRELHDDQTTIPLTLDHFGLVANHEELPRNPPGKLWTFHALPSATLLSIEKA
jgi:hypothetical protein